MRLVSKISAWHIARYTGAIVLLLVVSVSWRFLGPHRLNTVASGVILAYIVVFCLLLPPRVGFLFFIGVIGIISVLTWINDAKIALTQMPLTALDLKIAISYPAGLLGALGAPSWLDAAILPASYLLVLAFFAITGATIFCVWKHFRSAVAFELMMVGLIFVLCVNQSMQFVSNYLIHLQVNLQEDPPYNPKGVARLSHDLGVLPFLLLSMYLDNAIPGSFYDRHFGTLLPPSPRNILRSITTSVDFSIQHSAKLPNIIIVLAESTFDPNLAFRLRYPVESDLLFTPTLYTAALGPLLVNAVGGGTWITEFETITGLDSRLFGYSGYYTHSSLSPFVKNTLASYLSKRGYHTSAYYPHPGAFYNARHAYQHYGFDKFYDNDDIGRPEGWKQTDVQIIDTFIGAAPSTGDGPFFSYILLVENHSPHPCQHFNRREEFATSFVGTDDWELNCSLNEYILRLRSTEQAMKNLISYMDRLEKTTGRPFVILIFGDHQPHTFTSTKFTTHDYEPLRTDKSNRETFFHVLASAPHRLKCCLSPVPASLLPTLVSAFVAKNPDDIYLGMNFYLYSKCGSDFVNERMPSGIGAVDTSAKPRQIDECTLALEKAIAAYRQSGIMQYSGGSGQQ